MISYHIEKVKTPPIPKRMVSKWITEVAQLHGFKVGDLNYIFCSDEKILEVNNQYLQHDYYTDIITFDYSEKTHIHGDVFVSLDTVKSNAEKYGSTFEQELYRVLVHGVLHLCGQKDTSASERAEMTRKENEALRILSKMQSNTP